MCWSELGQDERAMLVDTARTAIAQGLRGESPRPRPEAFPESLREPGASFVTLHVARELRGCIGTLEAHRPVIADVAHNAWSAAFRDPRFAPLSAPEFSRLDIHVSLLTAPQPLDVTSEDELLRVLRPGEDGLILEEGMRRGTFLPSVWEQLPDPREFVQQLKRKAGLPAVYWSRELRVSRYTTVSVS